MGAATLLWVSPSSTLFFMLLPGAGWLLPLRPAQLTMPFEEWAELRARHRARFWRNQRWMNLKPGTITRWTMHQRHWPESYLTEFIADLSDHLLPFAHATNFDALIPSHTSYP